MTETVNHIAENAGERLDALLPSLVSGLSRSAAQRLIEEGRVLVDGFPVRKNYRVRCGDRIQLALPEPEAPVPQPQNLPLEIVYEDDDLIVVNKARGMVVHPAPGHPDGTLVNALLYHCAGSLSGIGGQSRPGIVHRIDKDTSGLLVAAKNDFAHQSLSAQLSDHSLSRIYEAIARGRFREDQGTVNAPIGRHPADRKRMAVNVPGARAAVTHYEVLASYRQHTHIRCILETGRTHQIRVHMESIGHPLLGDPVYGVRRRESPPEGQYLHARSLRFRHPRRDGEIFLTTPLPDYFQKKLSALGRAENVL